MTTAGPRRGEGRSIARGAAALTFYLALVVFLTWPLGRHLTTHLPDTSIVCRFDGLLIVWALSHESRALASRPTHLADANIYFPVRRALFYGEAGLGALPYFMPPFLATGNPALAINLTFVVSLALLLNGYGSYWPSGFPERMALADRLPDPDALAELRRSTALTTVVVHTALLDEARRARWQALAAAGAQGGLRLFARHGQALVFVVDPVAGGPPAP